MIAVVVISVLSVAAGADPASALAQQHGNRVAIASASSPRATGTTAAPAEAVAPGSVGYRGSMADLTVYSPEGPAPAGCNWHVPARTTSPQPLLMCRGDNIVWDHVHIRARVQYVNARWGTMRIANSVIDADRTGTLLQAGTRCNLHVSDSTIRWGGKEPPFLNKPWDGKSIKASPGSGIGGSCKMTLLRNDISGQGDGIFLGGSNADDSVFESNWTHDPWREPIRGVSQHHDGIQTIGGDRLIIKNNYVDVGWTGRENAAAYLEGPHNVPLDQVQHDVQLIGNYLAGGGYVLRNYGVIGLIATDNVFKPLEPEGNGVRGQFGSVHLNSRNTTRSTIAAWENNRFTDGRPVPTPT
jgi:hypothetical protein